MHSSMLLTRLGFLLLTRDVSLVVMTVQTMRQSPGKCTDRTLTQACLK